MQRFPPPFFGVSHSMGGQINLRTAVLHKGLFHSLALSAPMIGPKEHSFQLALLKISSRRRRRRSRRRRASHRALSATGATTPILVLFRCHFFFPKMMRKRFSSQRRRRRFRRGRRRRRSDDVSAAIRRGRGTLTAKGAGDSSERTEGGAHRVFYRFGMRCFWAKFFIHFITKIRETHTHTC